MNNDKPKKTWELDTFVTWQDFLRLRKKWKKKREYNIKNNYFRIDKEEIHEKF